MPFVSTAISPAPPVSVASHGLSCTQGLPCVDVKVFLAEEGSDDRPVREFPASQRSERLRRRSRILELDVDLANTGALSGACRAGHLRVEKFAVLSAFVLDVFENF